MVTGVELNHFLPPVLFAVKLSSGHSESTGILRWGPLLWVKVCLGTRKEHCRTMSYTKYKCLSHIISLGQSLLTAVCQWFQKSVSH